MLKEFGFDIKRFLYVNIIQRPFFNLHLLNYTVTWILLFCEDFPFVLSMGFHPFQFASTLSTSKPERIQEQREQK